MLDYKSKEALNNLKNIISDENMKFNEQTTKHFLILPFFTALNYNINDPRTLMHEYTPSQLKGSADKVDYVLKLEEFMVFIEAKALNTNLEKYYHQLQKYFNSTAEAKLGIITDGRHYHFFTDFYHQNLMDMDPFYKIDLLHLKDFDYHFLSQISQDNVSLEKLQEVTEEIIFKDNLLSSFKKVIEELPPDFIKLILKDFYPHPVTKKVIDRATSIAMQTGLNNIDLSTINKNLTFTNGGTTTPPTYQRTPKKGVSLSKGEQKPVVKEGKVLDRIKIGLGWDVSKQEGVNFDLDAQVFLLNKQEKVPNDHYFVFFNNPASFDGSTSHGGDNTTGEGKGDDETIQVQLSRVSPEIDKLVFIANIHDGKSKGQSFKDVQNAFIRVVDMDTNEELLRYDLTQRFANETMILFATLSRVNDNWVFNAVGDGYEYSLIELCGHFGVNIE